MTRIGWGLGAALLLGALGLFGLLPLPRALGPSADHASTVPPAVLKLNRFGGRPAAFAAAPFRVEGADADVTLRAQIPARLATAQFYDRALGTLRTGTEPVRPAKAD